MCCTCISTGHHNARLPTAIQTKAEFSSNTFWGEGGGQEPQQREYIGCIIPQVTYFFFFFFVNIMRLFSLDLKRQQIVSDVCLSSLTFVFEYDSAKEENGGRNI